MAVWYHVFHHEYNFIIGWNNGIVPDTRPGGEVANAAVCKTAIRGFESRLGLKYKNRTPVRFLYLARESKLLPARLWAESETM